MQDQMSQTTPKKTRRPLTCAEQEMVSDNLRLVYFFCGKYAAPYGMDREDWVAECMVELVRAVQYYDPSIGKFSCLLDRFIFNRRGALNSHHRHRKKGKVIDFALDEKTLLDIGVCEHPWHGLDAGMVAQQAMEILTPQEADILQRLADGYSIREIADQFGRSHQRISQLLEIARTKCADKLPGERIEQTQCILCGNGCQQYGLTHNKYCCHCKLKRRYERKLDCERRRHAARRLAEKNARG